ncbi:General amino-acid permease GAP2 [Hyphodiscus hymeniophilus]|uniref:General amino-acid permease GAP2 n=1 Tax=Hyphodiscus hymeniophilus TaxID=353542 RepID=A0A9P6VF54_9HELO|nr:General amino-acid permease GAP2 [Hyphodiscus hymeniophilus]
MSSTAHSDPEKGTKSSGEPEWDTSTGLQMNAEKQPWNRRFVDSFKRDPNAHVTKESQREGVTGRDFDHQAAAERTANSGLSRKLKSRHMQMIAIGGSIGTGLFVTSGSALSNGGPASLIIAFGLIGILMFCTVQALGELAVLFPVAGSFSAYSTRFIDPAWGFAMGWNYAIQWLVVLPLEIVAASITLTYWPGAEKTNEAAWVTIFLVVIVCINFFGVRGYGEAEFVFAIIKVVAVIAFIILGIILNCGGGPHGGYIGGSFWYPNTVPADYAGYVEGQPPGSIASGSFHSGFKGLCSVFVTAAFSFAGTELVGLAAAEASNPRKTLPTAIKQVFWRICLFYMVALTIVTVLVPYGDARLLGSSSEDAKASPFVIAINNAGISGLPSVFNVVILIAVLSVGNSSIYGSSRTLAALAEQGQAPRILAYIDRQGRPLVSIIVASILGLLCYVVAGGQSTAGTALNWLYSLSGLSSIFTWGSICLAHIRFRQAWKKQGHTLDELAFKSQCGVIGSWIGFILNVLVLIAQFWTAAWPIGYNEEYPTADLRVQNFFLAYLAFPVVVAFYIPYKIYYRTPFMKTSDMDLQTGRRELDTAALIEADRVERMQMPKWKRIYKIFC